MIPGIVFPAWPCAPRRAAFRVTALVLAGVSWCGSPPAGPPGIPAPALARQKAFRIAAASYEVPERLLLAVSYLESRWDAHRGVPSVTGGYGPMHLTDARTALRGGPPAPSEPARQRVDEAARLTGLPGGRLIGDPDANVLGGAALLASYQRELGLPPSEDPAGWYGAVARYAGTDAGPCFADEVFAVLRTGAARVTDDGQRVTLPPSPSPAPPDPPERVWFRHDTDGPDGEGRKVECPRGIACEWLPAPYRKLAGGKYGNHDLAERPRDQGIDYIVIHDTEATYAQTLKMVADPAYVSWHYTIRSADGHIAQHVRTKDVAWHSGNWYVNARSIGIEHEGFLAKAGAWYTEAMYRSSARLVRYLAKRFDIPLDRAHILGHDNVPGTVPSAVSGMHVDPGPYWDWAHYFALLGRPFKATGGRDGGLVTIRTDYPRHRPRYTGCGETGRDCPPHGSASVRLYIAPSADAPLVRDIGRKPAGEPTYDVYDHGARATTGQQFAVAGRRGDWTAIWYLGQVAWFHNPAGRPTAVGAEGFVVTPRRGADVIPVYGRAYPEPGAYPKGVPVQDVLPLQYAFPHGQRYAVGLATRGEYYHAVTPDPGDHRIVRGRAVYFQIQFGHRVAFVKAADVRVLRSGATPAR
ncbi:N-acetylmuramoyl-L-alanine amidase [Sphaerisporangium aureirubrum]|uniref:N-acetylmuramoyl-L-alanine amidase n=1 Tax=Sphaerisporangium aureirubrum TaxID=1544736 RepID=A0ABW1NUK1_9ACTN